MLLQEAILKKRPFKLSGMQWLTSTSIGQIVEEATLQPVYLTVSDMLSKEWVVREKESFITKTHLEKMFDRIMKAYPGRELDKLFLIIEEELGFRERTLK